MADLDVSVAIESLMLSDWITIYRRGNVVGVNGRANLQVSATYNAWAVVVPASPRDLQRLSDDQFMQRAINVTTEFTLQGAATLNGSDQAPDWISWGNDTYQVISIDNLTNFGMGFTNAICTLVDANPLQQNQQDYQGGAVQADPQ